MKPLAIAATALAALALTANTLMLTQEGSAEEETPWHPDSLMARPVEVRYVRIAVDAVVDDPSLPADALGGGSWKGPPPLKVNGSHVVMNSWSMAWMIHEKDLLVELVDGRTINGRSVAYTTLYAGVSGTSMSVPVAGQDLVVLPTGPDGALFTGPFFGTDHLLQVGQGAPLVLTIEDSIEEVLWDNRTSGERVTLPATYQVTLESFGDVTLDLAGREYFMEHPETVRDEQASSDRRMRLTTYRL